MPATVTPLRMHLRPWATLGLLGTALALAGCNSLPTSGPSRDAVTAPTQFVNESPVQIVPVTETVARRLLGQRNTRLFSEGLTAAEPTSALIGPGDSLEVNIWEAPPATLFGGGAEAPGARAGSMGTSRAVTFPEQVVNSNGHISIPFAGLIKAGGRTVQQIEDEVVTKLRGKANQPQVLVRLTRNASSNVTIVGDVGNSMRMPLTPRVERLLDALAAAGGTRNPVNKMTLQVTRGTTVMALPLETIIRDPRQNIPLQSGDVITALHQPLSFTAMGATGKNEEVNFEAQGISLAQAMARVGGLQDNRADPQGVFIFRYEDGAALDWPRQPAATTPEGRVPVIDTVDRTDPSRFFVMQTFGVQNKDVLYVSNAPLTEIQKFANVVFSIAFPVISLTR